MKHDILMTSDIIQMPRTTLIQISAVFTHSFHIACQSLIELGIYLEGQKQLEVTGRRRKIFFYCRSRFESLSLLPSTVEGRDLRRDFETTKKNNLIRRKNRVYFSMTCVPIPNANFLPDATAAGRNQCKLEGSMQYHCNLYYFCLHILLPYLIGMPYVPEIGVMSSLLLGSSFLLCVLHMLIMFILFSTAIVYSFGCHPTSFSYH